MTKLHSNLPADPHHPDQDQQDHTATPQQTSAYHGTPGHAAPAAQAISAVRRQRAYRLRSKRAVTQAIGEEANASRVTLVALLNSTLATLDDKAADFKHPPARNAARRVINTLVTRYGIDLEDKDRT